MTLLFHHIEARMPHATFQTRKENVLTSLALQKLAKRLGKARVAGYNSSGMSLIDACVFVISFFVAMIVPARVRQQGGASSS